MATTYQTVVTTEIDGTPVTLQTLTIQTTRSIAWVKGYAEKHLRINDREMRHANLTVEAWTVQV